VLVLAFGTGLDVLGGAFQSSTGTGVTPGSGHGRRNRHEDGRGAVKFFLTAEIEQKKGDARWMNKATGLIRLKIKDKNERAAKSRTLKGSVSTTIGNATNGNNFRDLHA
jgi:hypothetical protein